MPFGSPETVNWTVPQKQLARCPLMVVLLRSTKLRSLARRWQPPRLGSGELVDEGGRDVALAPVGEHDDDVLARRFGPACDGERGRERGARGDAGRDAFLARQLARALEGLIVGDADDVVDDGGVEDGRHEAGAEALDEVWTRLAAREHGAVGRLDGDDAHARLLRLEDLADAGDRATGADAGDEDVDL